VWGSSVSTTWFAAGSGDPGDPAAAEGAVLELTTWFREADFPDRTWLIMGKGPTFARRDQFDLSAFQRVSLNHVVNVVDVDVAHIADIHVVGDCAERLAATAPWLLMPRVPHVRSTRGTRRLEEWFDDFPVLADLEARGRLVWYNAITGTPVPGSPVINVGNFSSEATLRILGRLGVRRVRTIGIDGGRSYSTEFDHLFGQTFLENGVAGYDIQFASMAAIAEEYGIDLAPLVEPLRVEVWTRPGDLLGFRVLEFAVRSHAGVPVTVEPRFVDAGEQLRDPVLSETARSDGGMIRCLALDASMLVTGDVTELYDLPRASDGMLVVPESWRSASDDESRPANVIRFRASALPWQEDVSPLHDVWFAAYTEAMGAGAVPPSEVEVLLEEGVVRPALGATLRLAPSRRSVLTAASRDLVLANQRVVQLEREVAALRSSTSWRIGSRVVQVLHAPALALERFRGRRSATPQA